MLKDKRLENKRFAAAVKTCLGQIGAPITEEEFAKLEAAAVPAKINWIAWSENIKNPLIECYQTDIRGEKICWPENNQPIRIMMRRSRVKNSDVYVPVEPTDAQNAARIE